MSDYSGNKRPFINLSLFTNLSESFSSDHGSKSPNSSYPMEFNFKVQAKSPRSYFEGNVVGLGIVAAMDEMNDTHEAFHSSKGSRAAKIAVSPRSLPIPIVSAKPFSKFSGPISETDEKELSESYTCVISHFGNNSIKKREYFDDEPHVTVTTAAAAAAGDYWSYSQGFPVSPPAMDAGVVGTGTIVFQAADFLNSCYLCKKRLHGLDIFMYRGEKAFCSAECRCKQILSDEHNEKCVSGALMSFDYSVSPCSAPGFYPAGVAAA